MYLFFDTETTGLPSNYKAPASDLENWPRIVSLSWLLADESGAELASADLIVKPDGFVIPDQAAAIDGITTEAALRDGVELPLALDTIVAAMESAKVMVAHNIQFDEKVLGAELLRAGMENHVAGKERQCTMQLGTDYCAIPGRYGYKWPSLQELHARLFDVGFDGGHSASIDVRACHRCYFELRRLNVLV